MCVSTASDAGHPDEEPSTYPSDDGGICVTTTEPARQQAGEVAGATTSAAADVAGTAKEQAGHVVGEAVNQAQDLMEQTRQQVTTQASEQTQRLAGDLRPLPQQVTPMAPAGHAGATPGFVGEQLAEQLTSMAQSGQPGTTAHSLVQQLADHGHRAAGYLEDREPGDLVADLQSLGRRRPGAFLLGATVAGAVVGRLAAAKRKQASSDTSANAVGVTAETTGPGGTTALYPNAMPVRENVTPGTPTVEPYPATPTATAPAPVSPTTGGAL